METKLIFELNKHNVYYVKSDTINFYINVPKNNDSTSISIELKSKMSNYNLELNDEVWVMDNVNNAFSYIDEYNITLVLPVLGDAQVDILEKIDSSKYDDLDRIFAFLINTSYKLLRFYDIEIEKNIKIINNDRYKTFINWFTTKYSSRVQDISLLELIQLFNVNATSYKKLETPVMNFVVGSYNTEVDAPRNVDVVPEEIELPAKQKLQTSSGFASYWFLVIITLVIAGIVAVIAFVL